MLLEGDTTSNDSWARSGGSSDEQVVDTSPDAGIVDERGKCSCVRATWLRRAWVLLIAEFDLEHLSQAAGFGHQSLARGWQTVVVRFYYL
jgi:hypothetical protein